MAGNGRDGQPVMQSRLDGMLIIYVAVLTAFV
jgi:hypothetical protein